MLRWYISNYVRPAEGRLLRVCELNQEAPRLSLGGATLFQEVEVLGDRALVAVAATQSLHDSLGVKYTQLPALDFTEPLSRKLDATGRRQMAEHLRAAGYPDAEIKAKLGSNDLNLDNVRFSSYLNFFRDRRVKLRYDRGRDELIFDGAPQTTAPLPFEAQAFGGAILLDDVTRGDEDPMNTNWGEPVWFGDGSGEIVSNQVRSNVAGWGGSYYSAGTFGPDLEFNWVIPDIDSGAAAAAVILYLRLINPGGDGTMDGYYARFQRDNIARFARVDNTFATQIGADFSQDITDGDSVGIRAKGSLFTLGVKSAGVWGTVGTRTDGSHTATGNLGFELKESALRGGSFFAGAVPFLTIPPPVAAIYDINTAVPGISASDSSANIDEWDLSCTTTMTLTVVLSGGVTVTAGSNNSSAMTLGGTQAALNTVMGTLSLDRIDPGVGFWDAGDTINLTVTDADGNFDTGAISVAWSPDSGLTKSSVELTGTPGQIVAMVQAPIGITPAPNFFGGVSLGMRSESATFTDLDIVALTVLQSFVPIPHPVPTSSVRIYIDFLEQTGLVVMPAVSISLELHTRSQARFSLITEQQEGIFYRPLVGETIRIDFEGETIFAGTVEGIAARKENGVEDKLFVEIEAVSWEQICDRKLVAEAYVNKTLEHIVTDIWADHLQTDGITISQVDLGPTLEKAVWNYETATQVFNDLAGIAGFEWWIDVAKGLHFVAHGTMTAPFTLMGGSQYFSAEFSRERGDYRNRQFVRAGDDKTDARTDKFKGDGEKKSYTLNFNVGDTPSSIKVDSVEKTIGVLGVEETDTKEWFYQLGSDKITQSDTDAALSGTAILEVTYRGLFPLLVISVDADEVTARQIIEGGSGLYDAVEDRETIDEAAFAFDLANKILNQKGLIPDRLQFFTKEKGLRPAQLLPVNLPAFGLDQDMLITRMEFQEVASDPLQFFYDVECLSGVALGGWAEFFMSLSRAGKKFRHRDNEVAGPILLLPEPVTLADTMTPTTDSTPCGIVDVDEIGRAQVCV